MSKPPTSHEARPDSLTVQEVARRYRVSPDKVRGWITRGELKAINTASALCARPRWVVTPEALRDFERARQGCAPTPKAQRKRREPHLIDFYPD